MELETINSELYSQLDEGGKLLVPLRGLLFPIPVEILRSWTFTIRNFFSGKDYSAFTSMHLGLSASFFGKTNLRIPFFIEA